ncbi:MAG: DUF4105 domain-containing protein [Sulfurimonas sp.]|nr:DUF4105 domain-containing protein [Sulfurimonas sp.]
MNLKKIFYIIATLGFVFLGIFVSLSLYYRLDNSFFKIVFISIFLFSSTITIVSFRLKHFRLVSWGFYLVFLAVWLFWYKSIEPSNERDWQRDVAVLSYATRENNLVKFHNIRNFKYITEYEYKISYYDETFDINKLNGIDFITTYWMGKNIAHTFLSFSFSDNKHLAISVEARKEMGASYSALRGFFKDSELIYVVADERDLIGLRTNIRKNPPEYVYMYQIDAKLKDKQKIFLSYVEKINELQKRPKYYNTLTRNCTTSIWSNSLVNYPNLKINWEIFLTGYSANYLYDNKLLKSHGLSFKELKRNSFINPLVDDKPIDSSYSIDIRSISWAGIGLE